MEPCSPLLAPYPDRQRLREADRRPRRFRDDLVQQVRTGADEPGDIILLGANTPCRSEPEGHITVTPRGPGPRARPPDSRRKRGGSNREGRWLDQRRMGAPGGTRTHNTTVLSRLPLPIGPRGRPGRTPPIVGDEAGRRPTRRKSASSRPLPDACAGDEAVHADFPDRSQPGGRYTLREWIAWAPATRSRKRYPAQWSISCCRARASNASVLISTTSPDPGN